MKHLPLFLACFLALPLVAQRTGKDYAVFFYVTDFQSGWVSLPETKAEALELKTELEINFNFSCETVQNPSKKTILDKIRFYNDLLTANDQVMFFFSMHGHYESGTERSYLVAADGLVINEYGTSYLSYDEVRAYLARCKAKHVLLAFDACYSGAFALRSKGRPDTPIFDRDSNCLTKINHSMRFTGKQFFTSGNKEARTPTKSLFARRILEALRMGGEDGLVWFDDLEYYLGKVENPRPESGSFNGHEPGGDFVFVRKNACPQLVIHKTVSPTDGDADGVLDGTDACPDTWASTKNGCPDADEDGVSDNDDKCPYEKGSVTNKGCPIVHEVADRDEDGVPDSGDQCPDSKGIAKYSGCPDTDGDGLPDKFDKCPNEKGIVNEQGCPDSDRDKIVVAEKFDFSAQRNGKDYAVFFVASKFDNNWSPLPYSLGEMIEISTVLHDQYSFDVRIVPDARRVDIIQTLGEYKKKSYGSNDQLLLFFSMHGYHDPDSDKGYLIPKDGLYEDPTYDSWFSHSQLAEIATSLPCRRVLISLDACFSGIFGGGKLKPVSAAWEKGNDCKTKIEAAFRGDSKTRKYATAGGDQSVPKKSDFAIQWLRALRTGAGDDGLLSFAELAAILDQFKDQRPSWGDFDRSTTGDFVFVNKDGCAVSSGGGISNQDKTQWYQAQASNTLESYRKYLRECSVCLYMEDAESAIKRLKSRHSP